MTTVQPTLEDPSSFNDSAAAQSGATSGGEERAPSTDGGKMKLFPPSRAAAALIVGGEENSNSALVAPDANLDMASKKKGTKLFSLQSKWSGKETPSASKSSLLSQLGQGDSARQVLSPEQLKIQSQISVKESELSKLDQHIQRKINAKMDPKSRRSNSGKLLHSNSGSYSFFSPPKSAIHISNDEDLEYMISQQVEVSAQLASLIETYKALSNSTFKPLVTRSNQNNEVDVMKLPDGTLISDLPVPLHWVQPTR